MTLGDMIQEGLIKDNEDVRIEIRYPNGRAACIWKGKWFQDHMLNCTDVEVTGIAWNRETGWRLQGIVEEEAE